MKQIIWNSTIRWADAAGLLFVTIGGLLSITWMACLALLALLAVRAI